MIEPLTTSNGKETQQCMPDEKKTSGFVWIGFITEYSAVHSAYHNGEQGDHSPDTLKFPDNVRHSCPC